MTVRLYQKAAIVDKVDGCTKIGIVNEEHYLKGEKALLISFIGCIPHENGTMAEENWKQSLYFEKDVTFINEDISFDEFPDYFSSEKYIEKDDLYNEIFEK